MAVAEWSSGPILAIAPRGVGGCTMRGDRTVGEGLVPDRDHDRWDDLAVEDAWELCARMPRSASSPPSTRACAVRVAAPEVELLDFGVRDVEGASCRLRLAACATGQRGRDA